MAAGNKVVLTFAGDTKQLQGSFDKVGNGAKKMGRGLDGAEKKTGKLRRSMKGVGVAAAAGFAVAAAGAIKLGKDLVDAGLEGISVHSKFEQVFESMGGTASKAFKDAGNQANELSKAIGVDATSIEKVQTKLATFKNIWNDPVKGAQNFERATTLAFDLAAAGFGNAETNSAQLGKALNDPIKGMSALARSGVSFTEAEQEKIKKLQESGDLLGAQELMYKALESQVGGTAAAGATGADKMKAAWANFQDKVGRKLVPMFEKVAAFITDKVIPALDKFTAWAEENPTKIKVAAAVIGGVLVTAFVAWAVAAASAAVATIAATWPILAIIAAVALLVVGIYLLWKNWDKIWGFIKKKAVAVWEAIKDAGVSVWNWIKKLPGRIVDSFAHLGRALYQSGKDLVTGLINGIKNMAGRAIDAAKGIVSGAIDGARRLLGIASPSKVFHKIGLNVGEGLAGGLSASSKGVAKAAQEMLAHLGGGGTMFEDFSFRGMSATGGRFNDQLAAAFERTGKSFTRQNVASFLRAQAGSGGSGGGGSSTTVTVQGGGGSSTDRAVASLVLHLIRTGALSLKVRGNTVVAGAG